MSVNNYQPAPIDRQSITLLQHTAMSGIKSFIQTVVIVPDYGFVVTLLFCFSVGPTMTPLPGAEPALAAYTFREPHMGTMWEITLWAANKQTAERGSRAAFTRIKALDKVMSDYRPDSELMQLCQKAGGTPVPVSEDLFNVLVAARETARRSEGAFDVTVGPVVKLWRQARHTRKMPEAAELTKALELVGYDKMILDEKNQTVQLLKKGMQLDLGGIGKGFAADAALAVLRKRGLPRAMIAGGGDIVVGGPPPKQPGWAIGIANLDDSDGQPVKVLLLQNAAVSTSGDAEQFVEIGGICYSHVVDPRTGIGLVGRQSATVVAPTGTLADSLSKVVGVLGPARGMVIVDDTPGAAACMMRKTDKGIAFFASKRFADIPQRKE